MQRFVYFFMIFALSLATDVSVYDDLYYIRHDPKPVVRSAVPWKFGFTSSDWLYMDLRHLNDPPSVTNVLVKIDLVTVKWKMVTLSNGKRARVFVHQLNGPEVIITAKLYTSNGLCRSIRFAEGRVVSEKSEKEYKYTDICSKAKTKPCKLVVDFKDVICNGPSNVTQKKENLKTRTPLTDLENNNTTFVYNVSSSSHENMKISTNSSANNTDAKTTDNTVIIIVGSLSGITLILLAIILLVIWKRCWSNRSPQGTSDLPTNQNHQPFYLNLLFRRECDEEIAEIQQHHYEEIHPQVSTEGS